MKVLIKQATIADPQSPYNGQKKDLFIEGGFIKSINSQIDLDADTIVDKEGLIVSPGWIETFLHYQYPETQY